MKIMAQKNGVRITALILFFVFLILAVASTTVFRYGLSDYWYKTSTEDFTDTLSCQMFVSDGLEYISQYVSWQHDLTADYLGSYAGDAFSYVIRNIAEEVTVDTTDSTSREVSSVSVFGNGYELGTVTGYVNLPVEPYGGCYSEYLLFSTFFGARYLIALAVAVFFLLAVGSLAVASVGVYYRGKAGKLPVICAAPYDLQIVLDFMLLYLLRWASSRVLNTLYYYMGGAYLYEYRNSLFWWVDSSVNSAIVIAVLAIGFYFLMAHLGKGSFDLLMAKLARKISFVWLTAGLVLVHAIVLWMTMTTYLYSLWLLLFVIDAVALPFLLRMAAEAQSVKNAAHELAQGNLSFKIDAGKLHFLWNDLGQSLNSIGDGMSQAVEDRMRSERMKTELITNVSHDLKTPLTSVINYVGLLRGTTDEECRKEYLDVLDRQSAKLKKLTEDVLEASKAASGAVTVNAEVLNAGELLEQLVGEYEERMKAAGIEPVVRIEAGGALLKADGSLLCRVLENLITNIAKYAQPGTRAYFDLDVKNGDIMISVKNISREPLNISAEELMERFVRGDSSRNSEGSGLGLSIAKSLTDLMGGHLDLILDGDLFKAKIVFRQVPPESLPTPEAPQEEPASVS